MRRKENATDYRYMPDPDLMPIVVTDEDIKRIKESLPELPDARKERYVEEYELSNYDAEKLISSIEVANFFEEAAKTGADPKTLANIITTDIFRLTSPEDFNVNFEASKLGEIVQYIEEGRINLSSAKKIIETLFEDNTKSPEEIISEQDLEQINDENLLSEIIDEVLVKNQKAVEEYKSGKEKAIQSIIGQIMGKTKGKANPSLTIDIIKKKIK